MFQESEQCYRWNSSVSRSRRMNFGDSEMLWLASVEYWTVLVVFRISRKTSHGAGAMEPPGFGEEVCGWRRIVGLRRR